MVYATAYHAGAEQGHGAVVNLPDWKVRDRGFDPRSGIQVSKKQMFLPRNEII